MAFPQVEDNKVFLDDGSEYDGCGSPCASEIDIANTHESNKDLAGRKEVKDFFEFINGINHIDQLKDPAIRDRIGSQPSRWENGAIPLFTHNETDYQLHFSYTWMKAIRTSGYTREFGLTDPGWSLDFYVHGLAWASHTNSMKFEANPLVVIPLGKLFVNRAGRSSWTGYEMFVGNSLEVWMIYVPDEQNPGRWQTVDSGLFPAPQEIDRNQPTDNPADQASKQKLVRFCSSLSKLQTATPQYIRDQARQTRASTGSPYLLEVTRYQAQNALQIPQGISSPAYLEISLSYLENPPSDRRYSMRNDNPIVRPGSPLESQPVHLALENVDEPIVQVSFGSAPTFANELPDSSLLSLLAERRYLPIMRLINESANIDTYAGGTDFSDPNLITTLKLAWEDRLRALFAFLRDRIEFNTIDASGTTPFLKALEDMDPESVELILKRRKIDVSIEDRHRNTPPSLAMEKGYHDIVSMLEKTTTNPKV